MNFRQELSCFIQHTLLFFLEMEILFDLKPLFGNSQKSLYDFNTAVFIIIIINWRLPLFTKTIFFIFFPSNWNITTN